MSTEYRRGIPSIAHVEAATRLGLEWEDDDVGYMRARWRLVIREEYVLGDYATSNTNYSNWDSGSLVRAPDSHLAYHPIRPDGTPVDWEVLDQEVARVGQRGQPQGFRADLWRRICELVVSTRMNTLVDISQIDEQGIESTGVHYLFRWEAMGVYHDSSEALAILTRWAVYQELKPLYDIIDGAQGEAAMPRDVINQWWLPARNADRARQPIERCILIRSDTSPRYPQGRGPTCSWYADGADVLDIGLRNFAAVLDAVAERRVAERMRGQT